MKHSTKIFMLGAALAATVMVSQAAPAAENWENLCAKCHGADGKGQTKVGKKLKAKDYTDAKVQAELKDEDMFRLIAEGAKGPDGKEVMKGFKGEISDAEITELVALIRKFKA